MKNKKTDLTKIIKKYKSKIILLFVILILLAFFDYFSIPLKHHIYIKNINFEFWELLLNLLTPLIIFFLTYKLIDEEEKEKNQNRKQLLIKLIEDTYKKIELWLGIMADGKLGIILESTKVNKKDALVNIENQVFSNNETIMDLVKEGILSEEIIYNYIEIKGMFETYNCLYGQKENLELIQKYESKIEERISTAKQSLTKKDNGE